MTGDYNLLPQQFVPAPTPNWPVYRTWPEPSFAMPQMLPQYWGSLPQVASAFGPTTLTRVVPDREPKLYFTVSCQRAGKSTKARKWLHRQESLVGEADDNFPRYMWDTDGLRLELYGNAWCGAGETMAFAIKRYAIAASLRNQHDVVVAGTHSSRTSIRRILEIRRDAIPVVIDTPLEVCLERAVATGQSYLLGVIPRVHAQVQALLAEGLDNVIAGILDDIDNKVPY